MKTKINLGAGNLLEDTNEWINHDLRKHRPEIELSFDLSKIPYPLQDNKFEEVKIFDVLEHLNNPLEVMNELHRIIKKGGLLYLRVAGWKSDKCWADITHKKVYDIDAFDALDPSTTRGQEYNYYSDKKWTIMEKVWDRSNSIRIKMTPIKE
jgi:predicted SAM-dependent methyltransferase